MTPHYIHTRRVSFAETDMAGIAHFANFYRWMEEAEHELFASLGLRIAGDEREGAALGWPRVSASFNFHKPVRYRDLVEVRIAIERIGVKSLAYLCEVWREGEHLATGRLKVACCLVTKWGLTSVAIPDEYLQRLPAPATTVIDES